MNWEQFYLICFGVGITLSFLFLLSGAFHLHVPGKWGMHHAGAPKIKVRVTDSASGAPQIVHGISHVSPFNLFSIVVFLAWFGGTGYLLTHYYSFLTIAAFLFACLAGLAGGALVFYFLTKAMIAGEKALEDEDFEMVGIVGRVSGTIRAGGFGEIIFAQNGKRKAAAARSENGTAIPRNTEIVVTRYEGGTAYVRPWREFAQEHSLDSQENADSAGAN